MARVANSGGYGLRILVVVESGLCDHGIYVECRENDVKKNPVRRGLIMDIIREKPGFYRVYGKKNLRIVKREGGYFVEQYPIHGAGCIGPVKTLREAKEIATLESE